MANTIITKNSSTASAVPTAGDLVQGELAVNVTDKRLFTEDAGGNIVEIGTNPSTINIDAGTIDGTAIGGTTPTTGAFTTLSASTSVTSPSGLFTNLSASGSVTLSGGTANGVAYLNGSKVLTSGSALTFDGSILNITGTATMDGLTVDGDITINDASPALYLYDTDGTNQRGLVIQSGADMSITSRNNTAMGNIILSTSDGSFTRNRLKVDGVTGDISFYEDTGTTPKFFWDASAESLGIGTSSPGAKLDVANTSGSVAARLRSSDSGYAELYFADVSDSAASAISYEHNTNLLRFYNGGSVRATIDSSGNLLLGTTSNAGVGISFNPGTAPGAIINKSFSGTADAFRFRYNGSGVGGITYSNTATSYNTSSDYRLKEDWVVVADASTRVKALKPVNFAWKADGKRVDGFLAHELADVVPEAVTGEKDAVDADGNPVYQGIDQSKLVPLLTAALQEALSKIDSLESRLTAAGL